MTQVTQAQAAYIHGWRDATEFITDTLSRAANNPAIRTDPAGQEVGNLLREISLLINQHLTKMADTLCTHSQTLPTDDPPYRN